MNDQQNRSEHDIGASNVFVKALGTTSQLWNGFTNNNRTG